MTGEADKSGSSDESWTQIAMPYEEFDFLVSITEAELVEIGNDNTKSSTWGLRRFPCRPSPVSGCIRKDNTRFMIPLVVQRAGKPKSTAVYVWFLVDTGAPFTTLTLKTLETILGQGNATKAIYKMSIQNQQSEVECHVSTKHFSTVNLLGADGLHQLDVSILVNWKNNKFQLVSSDKIKIL